MKLPGFNYKKGAEAKEKMLAYIDECITREKKARRQRGKAEGVINTESETQSFIQKLIEATDHKGRHLSDEELRIQMLWLSSSLIPKVRS